MEISRFAIEVPEAFSYTAWKALRELVGAYSDFLIEWALDTIDVEAQSYASDTDYDDFVLSITEMFVQRYQLETNSAILAMIDDSYSEMKKIRKVAYKALQGYIDYVEAKEENSVTVTLDSTDPEVNLIVVNFIIN